MLDVIPASPLATILASRCRDELMTSGGIPAFVSELRWPKGTPVEALDATPADEVVLTQDGRHYDRTGWHQGPEAQPVYVERWTRDGLAFHGWIDSVSRRLVQAG